MNCLKAIFKALIPNWLIVYKNTTGSGVVLTFDDGPDEIITPKILEILKENNINAIFFVLGSKAVEYPDLVRQIQEEGHIIGNHSFNHISADKCRPLQYFKDIKKCQKCIKEITGQEPRYFRPPLGRITIPSLLSIKINNLMPVMWSIESGEWGNFSHENTHKTLNRLLGEITNKDVLLMHDNSEKVPFVLEGLIAELKIEDISIAHPLDM